MISEEHTGIKRVKVLHVMSEASRGGAHRAAARIVCAQHQYGLEAEYVTRGGSSRQEKLFNWLKKKSEALVRRILMVVYRTDEYLTIGIGTSSDRAVIEKMKSWKPDVMNLHWIADGLLRFTDIEDIARRKLVVWTLHDCWPFLGARHYPRINGSDSCKDAGFSKMVESLLEMTLRERKAQRLGNVVFVSPSRWLGLLAKRSLEEVVPEIRCRFYVIPNPVSSVYFEEGSLKIRHWKNQKTLLILGCDKKSSYRKGLDRGVQLFRYLVAIDKEIRLAIVGCKKHAHDLLDRYGVDYGERRNVDIEEYIDSEVELAKQYAACSMTLVLSRMDNLPQVATESLSCGTPVIGTHTGGIVDVVEDGVNGYLVDPLDLRREAVRIYKTLSEDTDLKALSSGAFDKAQDSYSELAVAEQYARIYKKHLNEKNPGKY